MGTRGAMERPALLDRATAALPAVTDATLGRAAATGLGLGSFLRRRRIFHPQGVAFAATWTADDGADLGVPHLDGPRARPVTVRLSRGLGLPDGRPDIYGLAVRWDGVDEGGGQDLLLASVLGDGGPGQHVLAPAGALAERPLSTILPYRAPAGLVVFTAIVPEADARGLRTLDASAAAFERGDLTIVLRANVRGAEPVTVGRIRSHRRLARDEAEALRFNPWNATSALEPAGALNALRRRSYAASQRARERRAR